MDPRYYLDSYTFWKRYNDSYDKYFSGIQLTFKDEFGISANVVKLLGSTGNSKIPPIPYIPFDKLGIKEQIVQVYICGDDTNPNWTGGIFFKHADGTWSHNPDPVVTLGCCNFGLNMCDPSTSYYLPATGELPGRLRGLSFRRNTSMSDYQVRPETWSVWYDNDPCSKAMIPVPTMADITIVLNAGPVTVDLSSFMTYNYATGCGATFSFALIDPVTGLPPVTPPAFLSFSGNNLIGESSNSAHIG